MTASTAAAAHPSSTATTTSVAAPTTPAANSPARFGTTHRWSDGVTVKVTKPVPFWPSGWVREVNTFTHFMVVMVTIKNGSGAAVDLADLQVLGRSAGADADPVHDPGKVGPAPPARVSSGKSAAFRLAMGVKKPGNLQVRVILTPSRTAAVFGP